jgi:hypothetical protein
MTNYLDKAAGNRTELVFCDGNVDPELVSRLLVLSPSESYKAGDEISLGYMSSRIAPVGLWRMPLPGADPSVAVEQQIERWLVLLTPKATALSELRQRGYRPYVDCKAQSGSLSLCIAPDILTQLGSLGLALSVWLFEQPAS